MPSNFTENYFRGVQMAEQEIARRRQDDERKTMQAERAKRLQWEDEDRQFSKQERDIKLQLDMAKLAESRAKMLEGQPGPRFQTPGAAISRPGEPTPTAPQMQGPGFEGLNAVLAQARSRPVDVNLAPVGDFQDAEFHAPVKIPDIDFGGGNVVQMPSVRPRTQAGQEYAAMRETQRQREANTYTITDPTTGKPISGPKELLDNFMTQIGQNARDAENRTARVAEAEADRAAAAERNESAINARLQTARLSATARLEAARIGGQNEKAIRFANSKVEQFLGLPQVRKYAETAEISDYITSFPVKQATASDDYDLLVTHAKAVDPGSVAREGEVAAATKYAQSLLESFGMSAQRVLSNQQALTESARKAVIEAIKRKIAPNEQAFKNMRQFYKTQIAAQGLGPEYAESILPNFSLSEKTLDWSELQ
jgi:hypothetical protein